MKLISLAVIALVLQAGEAPARKAAPRELMFNWPVGIEARVETERSRMRSGTVSTGSPPVRVVQRMRVLSHPEGRLIDFEVAQDTFTGLVDASMASGLTELLQGLVPSFVVAADGRLIRVEGIARQREAVAALLKSTAKPTAVASGVFDKLMEQVFSEKVLTVLARDEWNFLVSSWTGLPRRVEMFNVQMESPSPIFPGTNIPINLTAGIASIVRCNRSGVERECVEVRSRQSFDQKVMSKLIEKMVASITDKDLGAVKYERMDVVTAVRLRLEADTMLPHELHFQRTSDMAVREPKGGLVEVRQVDRRTSKFIY